MRKIILSIFVVGCLLVTSIASVNAIDTNGIELPGTLPPLVLSMHFNEGSGDIAYDMSAWSNHVTIYGATWTTGYCVNALEYDGDDDYVETYLSDYELHDARAYIAWIKTTTGGTIFSKEEVISSGPELIIHGFALAIDYDSKSLVFRSNGRSYYGGEVPMNEWVHVIAREWMGLELYINGELDSIFTDYQRPKSNDVHLRIGASSTGFTDYFNGKIDEVRMECPELNITDLYENQPPSTPTISGPTSGEAGTEYEYTLNSEDPVHINIGYIIDWGDGDFPPWYDWACGVSGEDVIVRHTWENTGEYTIKVKAFDKYIAESYWETLPVAMPINYNQYNQQSYQYTQNQNIPLNNPNSQPINN